MTISKQNTMINVLKAALANITTVNGFQSTVQKVMRGVRGLDDFSAADLPGLTIFRAEHEINKRQYGGEEGKHFFNIWGFVKVEARSDDYDALDKLVADTEKCLMDETYNGYMLDTFITKTSFYEGGIQDSFGFFNMEVEVSYNYDLGDI